MILLALVALGFTFGMPKLMENSTFFSPFPSYLTGGDGLMRMRVCSGPRNARRVRGTLACVAYYGRCAGCGCRRWCAEFRSGWMDGWGDAAGSCPGADAGAGAGTGRGVECTGGGCCAAEVVLSLRYEVRSRLSCVEEYGGYKLGAMLNLISCN